jgi:hypothetical protein
VSVSFVLFGTYAVQRKESVASWRIFVDVILGPFSLGMNAGRCLPVNRETRPSLQCVSYIFRESTV